MLAFLVTALALAVPVSAQERTVQWDRWDVDITNVDVRANFFTVTESYDLTFTGLFRFGTAFIPLGRVEDIRNIRISQDGVPLVGGRTCGSSSGGSNPGTFCTVRRSGNLEIVYDFRSPINSGSTSIVLQYDVVGNIRIYESGDQIWWNAIPSEHFGFPILSATVQVELPPDLGSDFDALYAEAFGVPSTMTIENNTVTARATEPLLGDQYFEIRVEFPHTAGVQPPAWQAGDDFQRQTEPWINIGALVLGAAIAIGGSLFIVTRYLVGGRDPEVGVAPEYLTEPPGSLPPAVVGALVDETVDMRDIMSTLLDLARRGFIVFEENRTPGLLGIGSNSEFTFKLTGEPLNGLRDYEQTLVRAIFGGAMERSMDSLRNRFYTSIPTLTSQIDRQLVSEGLLSASPAAVRGRWAGGGLMLIFFAVFLFFAPDIFELGLVPATVYLIPGALILVGLLMALFSGAMPRKTQKGAEEKMKWQAFERYLRNLQKYDGVSSAAQRFEEYLPYAVAFGIDRMWMRQFEQSPMVFVPIPRWYYPTYMGPYRGGYRPGTPVGVPGEAGGGFSLENMSGGLSNGLENLSSGLSNMLESASRTMTSRPSSSSSGGRGGFGGGSFGGGGGGGSRGFG
jgi:uncharacterized membrane protein YgcG